MQRYFGPTGLLAQKSPGFEFRESQWAMANAVQESLNKALPLIIEAGTGTGKTWAYLIPVFLSGKRVVVSTGSKTLQDQILDHDIPFLKRLISPRLQVACLKGRKNYLCRRRLRDFTYQPTFWNQEEARSFRRFQQWAERTGSGDRAEIPWLPDHFQYWNEVTSSGDQCLGQKCDDYQICFLNRARIKAAQAEVVVVNHHLFFADLALRSQGFGVLPDYEAVVFDEAHELEDTLGLYYGVQFSNLRILELSRDLAKECRKEHQSTGRTADLHPIVPQLEGLSRLLHNHFHRRHGNSGRFPLRIEEIGPGLLDVAGQIIGALEHTTAILGRPELDNPGFELLHHRCLEMAVDIRKFLDQEDSSLIYWYEVAPKIVHLYGTPAAIDTIFPREVIAKTSALVLTSATLSVAGTFDYFRRSLGLPAESKELLLASPFDFAEQALLYVPKDFPAPHEPDFCARVAEEALDILQKSRGRALFLFTSYRNMHEVYGRLKDRLPYPLLVQGQKPKRALLAEFKAEVESVLFATSSFWQGIDVPGEALSCLLIDKLPFEVPDDPVNAARMERMSQQGQNPFFNYQVPRAIIQLKQGVGRLIRGSQDRGIISIFDVRLTTKGYGQHFFKSLPPCRLVHGKEHLEGFLEVSAVPYPDKRQASQD
jgi:ATP-dependent DNA helicase DinG